MTVYVIQAARAPVAVVFRRRRSKWWLLSRWRLDTGELEPGASFQGTLYPRRCELSPDGELLYYFAMKGSPGTFVGQGPGLKQFSAVSRAPWLTALAAWKELGAYTPGCHFVPGGRDLGYLGPPQHGTAEPLLARYGLTRNDGGSYATERRHGWVALEEGRARIALARARPGGGGRLVLVDERGGAAKAPGLIEGARPCYHLELSDRRADLAEAVWADWGPDGALLLATRSGRLQIHAVQAEAPRLVREHDLTARDPAPTRSPEWARSWEAPRPARAVERGGRRRARPVLG